MPIAYYREQCSTYEGCDNMGEVIVQNELNSREQRYIEHQHYLDIKICWDCLKSEDNLEKYKDKRVSKYKCYDCEEEVYILTSLLISRGHEGKFYLQYCEYCRVNADEKLELNLEYIHIKKLKEDEDYRVKWADDLAIRSNETSKMILLKMMAQFGLNRYGVKLSKAEISQLRVAFSEEELISWGLEQQLFDFGYIKIKDPPKKKVKKSKESRRTELIIIWGSIITIIILLNYFQVFYV